MKKLRILVLLIILAFSFSVEAKVVLKVNCNGEEINSDKLITCEGWLSYATEGINDIEIKYNTNLNIEFNSVKGFTINKENNKVLIHTDVPLYDDIMFSSKIMEFTLSSNDKCAEEENVSFNNIKINNSDEVSVGNVTKSFSVILPKEEEVIPKEGNDNNEEIVNEIIPSSICTLDTITIDKVKVSGFDKNKFEYKGITINKEIPFIDAIRTDDKSSASGLGNVLVPMGETVKRELIVLAEDGTKCVYKLYITNITPKPTITLAPIVEDKEELNVPDEEVKSNDNTLKSLEVYSNKKKVDFKFDRTKDVYNIEVIDTNKVTIKATLNDSKASFDNIFKPKDVTLDLEDNEVLIKVIAENGDSKIYKLNIHVTKKDTDNTLSLLKINDEVINLADKKYEVKLPNNVTKTKIEAIANSDKSTIKYEDIDLIVGDNNVKITVTSEDGKYKEYDINVIREEEKISFERIEITGYDINFSKDKKSYTLKVDKNTNELDIKVIPNNIDFEVLNNNNLHNGNTVTIKVTDLSGVYEYNINIEKDSSSLNIVCYIVFGIGVVSLIAVIFYVLKKKKCKKALYIEEI